MQKGLGTVPEQEPERACGEHIPFDSRCTFLASSVAGIIQKVSVFKRQAYFKAFYLSVHIFLSLYRQVGEVSKKNFSLAVSGVLIELTHHQLNTLVARIKPA